MYTATYTLRPALPTFTPPGGTYATPQSVEISCATPDVTIHYTTNDVDPTEAHPVVTGPISIDDVMWLKARAYRTGWEPSLVQRAGYTFRAATPEFDPPGGTYSEPQDVSITCATPGATIRYTTDGSNPVETSPIASHNIAIDTITTLKAKAWSEGWVSSNIKSALYTLSLPIPAFTPPAGAYSSVQTVEIVCPVAGAEIHYTTDGSVPLEGDPLYSSPIVVSADTVLKARAWLDGWNPSGIGEAVYTFQPADPVFNPGPATRYSPLDVTITCATPGAQIRYTTNGSDPTESSPLYTGPIYVDQTMTLKARAWNSGWTPSDITEGLYTLKVHAPILSPSGGTFSSPVNVSMSCDTPGATIRYTTDGSAPNETSTIYTGPVYVNHSLTLRANAWKPGWAASTTRNGIYAFPVYVKPTGNDSNSGASWQLAKRTVAAGVDTALSGGEVWVASGTYMENITLKSGVALYGGFAGNESLRSRRDWNANPTILDGNQTGSVVTVPAGASALTRIDGFTIRNGIAPAGGGIYCGANSRVKITNNVITSNVAKASAADAYGGGICCYDAPAWIFNNVIKSNAASSDGGNWGGGIYLTGASPTIFSNTIVGNSAAGRPGSTDYGGGISCQSSAPMVHSNIIAFNSSGVANVSGAPELHSNNLYGNTAYDYAGFTPDKTNISEDPLFINYSGGDYHLYALSPCVDTGSNTLVPDTDMDGLVRPMDGNNDGLAYADMGAYEYPFDLSWARNIYPDGQIIAFGGVGVTADFSSDGFIYVEKSDRSGGIRVQTDQSLVVGARANVAGRIQTDPLTGERYIDAEPPYPQQVCGDLPIRPLGMINRALGGGTNGLQVGVTGGTGLNNIGLLVTVWGEVLSTDTDYFVIEDGSGRMLKCFLPDDVTMPIEGAYVLVTGISSCERSGSSILSILLPRDKRDIITLK